MCAKTGQTAHNSGRKVRGLRGCPGDPWDADGQSLPGENGRWEKNPGASPGITGRSGDDGKGMGITGASTGMLRSITT